MQTALERILFTTRTEALAPREKDESEDRAVAVTPYHPHNIPVCRILREDFFVLQQDPELKQIFAKPPLIVFQRDKNLCDMLVRSKLEPQSSQSLPQGCRSCQEKKCKACSFINTAIKIVGPTGTFTVKSSLNCKSSDVLGVHPLLPSVCLGPRN